MVGLLNVAVSQVARDLEKHDFSTVLKVKSVLPPERERRFQKSVFLRTSQKMSKMTLFKLLILRKMTPGRSP